MNCSQVAQLTQSISQLSLKPGDEEIKRKKDIVANLAEVMKWNST